MPCQYNFPLTEVCSPRFGLPVKGVHGRAGRQIEYIVLHQLTVDLASYSLEVNNDIPSTLIYGNDPRSVHVVVNSFGAAQQFVSFSDTAWGINYVNNPVIPLPSGESWNTFDNRVIHLAWEHGGRTTAGQETMANLICCLVLQFNIPLTNIVTITSFNDNNTFLPVVPTYVRNRYSDCVYDGGNVPSYPSTPVELQLFQLQQCCDTNTGAIGALDTRLDAVEASLAAIPPQITNLQNQINVLSGQVAGFVNVIPVINSQISEILVKIQAIDNCLASQNLCPEVCPEFVCDRITYRLSNLTDQMLITPNQPVRINMPNRIRDSNPYSVTVGPMWNARLNCGCNRQVSIVARLQFATWCIGKSAWIDMISCQGRARIANFVAATSNIAANLAGVVVISNDVNCDVYFELGIDDLSPKILEFAEVDFDCI